MRAFLYQDSTTNCCWHTSIFCHTCFIHSNYFVSDIDTDELDSDDKNVQVEKVEFLVKEEVTVTD